MTPYVAGSGAGVISWSQEAHPVFDDDDPLNVI
jgi:hypothetical protein